MNEWTLLTKHGTSCVQVWAESNGVVSRAHAAVSRQRGQATLSSPLPLPAQQHKHGHTVSIIMASVAQRNLPVNTAPFYLHDSAPIEWTSRQQRFKYYILTPLTNVCLRKYYSTLLLSICFMERLIKAWVPVRPRNNFKIIIFIVIAFYANSYRHYLLVFT